MRKIVIKHKRSLEEQLAEMKKRKDICCAGYEKVVRSERRLARENELLDESLHTALHSLAVIASITVFDDSKETYVFCLEEAQKTAAAALDELGWKPEYPGAELTEDEIEEIIRRCESGEVEEAE